MSQIYRVSNVISVCCNKATLLLNQFDMCMGNRSSFVKCLLLSIIFIGDTVLLINISWAILFFTLMCIMSGTQAYSRLIHYKDILTKSLVCLTIFLKIAYTILQRGDYVKAYDSIRIDC